jgi:hypothetical protein
MAKNDMMRSWRFREMVTGMEDCFLSVIYFAHNRALENVNHYKRIAMPMRRSECSWLVLSNHCGEGHTGCVRKLSK